LILGLSLALVNVCFSGEGTVNTSKLKEALAELQQQRLILDGAISSIQRIIATMNGGAETASVAEPEARKTSYIDDTVKLLEIAGQPLHIKEITKQIGEMRGAESARASIESSLGRHIELLKERARVVKVRPATYGLPIWKSLPKHSVAA
jgi:hypothetical protein